MKHQNVALLLQNVTIKVTLNKNSVRVSHHKQAAIAPAARQRVVGGRLSWLTMFTQTFDDDSDDSIDLCHAVVRQLAAFLKFSCLGDFGCFGV